MENKVFDPLRKKRIALTPEERVRQSLISWLIAEKRYPQNLMASEYSIEYNNLKFRCDIVVFDKNLFPLMIIECKAPSVKLTNEAMDQIIKYNLILKVKYLIITNGVVTFACKFNQTKQIYDFVNEIPDYEEIVSA